MHQIALCVSKVMLNVILADAVCLHLIKEISVSYNIMAQHAGKFWYNYLEICTRKTAVLYNVIFLDSLDIML